MFFSQEKLNWFKQVLFAHFGIDFILECAKDAVVLKVRESDKRIIFSSIDPYFYVFGEPNLGCYEWNAEQAGFHGVIEPILKAPSSKSLENKIIDFHKWGATVHYDILGLMYWMLNRLEEVNRKDLDNHDRFPAINSHAYLHGYLERPIVDEWLYILGQIIEKIWPDIQIKKHVFSIKVSHDVDVPSRFVFLKPLSLLRAMVALVIKGKDIKQALLAPYVYFNSKKKINHLDPFNTFDWIMDISEKNSLKSAFYFICGRTHVKNDALYEPENLLIKKLIKTISDRGHEIGLHPSYNSFNNPDQIKFEAQRLRDVCKSIDIVQNEWGGRMHFLRWSHPTTLQAWNDANMDYDSTLGYADMSGFRCGTCFEYLAFNPVTDQILKLRIRPLIVMDCTIIAERYMGLGYTQDALERILKYKNICRKLGGSFTLLWHNSFFNGKESFELYQKVIEG